MYGDPELWLWGTLETILIDWLIELVTTNLDFNIAAKCHAKLVFQVLGEDSLKCLLEQRRVERISHHHVTPNTADKWIPYAEECT